MSSHGWCIESVINDLYICTCNANVSQFVCCWYRNKIRTSFMSVMECLLVRIRCTETACCLTCKMISCRVCYNVCCSDYHLYCCRSWSYFLLPLNVINVVFVNRTVDSSLARVTFLLQVPRSGFSCPGGRDALSRRTSRLDTGAWCRLHLWWHRLASPRDIEGRHPAAYNLLVHRTSELPARTSDHRHHIKVGISILYTNLK